MTNGETRCPCGAQLIDGGPVGLYCELGLTCPDRRIPVRGPVDARPPTPEEARQRIHRVLQETGFDAWGASWYGPQEFTARILEALYGGAANAWPSDVTPGGFFSYAPGKPMRFHDTALEAMKAAASALDAEREAAQSETWHCDIEELCWGVVEEKAVVGYEIEDPSGDFDYMYDYVLNSPRD